MLGQSPAERLPSIRARPKSNKLATWSARGLTRLRQNPFEDNQLERTSPVRISEVRNHLQPARPTEGAAAAGPCPGPTDRISINAEVPVPTFSGMSMAPSSGAERFVSWLDSRPRPTPAEVEKILRACEAVSRAPESQGLARIAASKGEPGRPEGAEPVKSLHLRTFHGDANQQAQQLANCAAAVRRDDTNFAGAFAEEVKGKLRDGEEVVWKLPVEKFGKLTESSQELLRHAGIEVARLEDGDHSPHAMVHTKMLLVDGQDWALSDRL